MFIAQNYYPPDDEIFLFGFSRGAYRARSLAGFISACGLLKRQRLIMRRCNTDCHLAPTIRFLGMWDTVGAMGIPGKAFASAADEMYGFHDTGPCKLVKHGCHALALNENRHNFVPTLWTGTPFPGSVIEQVWFAGAHADVGGGYRTRELADISLFWMAEKAAKEGLLLDPDCLPASLNASAPTHDSSSGMFLLDSFRRTWRRVGETNCTVGVLENLYIPLDRSGQQLQTINESIHQSVVDRYRKTAPVCTNDDTGATTASDYEPTNLKPFFVGGPYNSLVPAEPPSVVPFQAAPSVTG